MIPPRINIVVKQSRCSAYLAGDKREVHISLLRVANISSFLDRSRTGDGNIYVFRFANHIDVVMCHLDVEFAY